MSPISKYTHMPWASTHPFDSRDIAVSIVKTILHFFFLASSLLHHHHHPRLVANEWIEMLLREKEKISDFIFLELLLLLNSEFWTEEMFKKRLRREIYFAERFFLTVFYQSCTQWCLHDDFIFFSVIMRMYFVVDEEINIIMTFWYFVGEIQGHCFSTFHKYK